MQCKDTEVTGSMNEMAENYYSKKHEQEKFAKMSNK